MKNDKSIEFKDLEVNDIVKITFDDLEQKGTYDFISIITKIENSNIHFRDLWSGGDDACNLNNDYDWELSLHTDTTDYFKNVRVIMKAKTIEEQFAEQFPEYMV